MGSCSQTPAAEEATSEEVSPALPDPTPESPIQAGVDSTKASPTANNGAQNENEQDGATINTAPTLAWKAAVGDGLAAPAKVAGGHVIVASHQGIFAFDPDTGQESWRVEPEGGVWSKSLAVGDGRVFAGVPGGLLALDAADGWELWFVPTQGEVLWAPLVEEVVYVGTAFVGPGVEPDPEGQAWTYALDPASGEAFWSVETEAYTLTTPATGAGTVFVGGSRIDDAEVEEGGHMRIHAYARDDGSLLWTADRTDGFLKSLASDGERLYYLAYTDMLYALEADSGEDLWRYPTENWSPGLTEVEGILYFGSDNAFVHAVTGTDGQAAWRTPLEGTFNSPRGRPAVDQDYVYFQGNDNQLYALDRHSGEIRWVTNPQPRSRTAVAVSDGRLYLSGQDGLLYAYR
jgi:outer membrane protein assembly factor BamB